MFKMRKASRLKGFTLVELLIVVIILAILAAVVVPQFSTSTQDAKYAALDTTLSNIRSAVEIYYQQHGVYPSAVAAGGSFGAVDTPAAFTDQMTKYTNAAGAASATKTGAFIYGPYLKADTLPTEPFSSVNTLLVSTAGTLPLAASGTTGWRFDNKTGQFIANGNPTR